MAAPQDGKCRFKPDSVAATCTGFVDVTSGSEAALQEAVATIGPVSVAIDAGHSSFQLYESGGKLKIKTHKYNIQTVLWCMRV